MLLVRNPKMVLSSWHNLERAIPHRMDVKVVRPRYVPCRYCDDHPTGCSRCMGYGIRRE